LTPNTLHNSLHAQNVALLMAQLLGPQVEQLSSLEAALLVLSAYFHDIGMVFTEEEVATVVREREWATFLEAHPEAYVEVHGKALPPQHIVEWYCRWRHADRVFVHLDRIPEAQFRWGVTNLKLELGLLCRSHGEDLSAIRDNADLSIDYLAKADLKLASDVEWRKHLRWRLVRAAMLQDRRSPGRPPAELEAPRSRAVHRDARREASRRNAARVW
jgi:hypothetical protein